MDSEKRPSSLITILFYLYWQQHTSPTKWLYNSWGTGPGYMKREGGSVSDRHASIFAELLAVLDLKNLVIDRFFKGIRSKGVEN